VSQGHLYGIKRHFIYEKALPFIKNDHGSKYFDFIIEAMKKTLEQCQVSMRGDLLQLLPSYFDLLKQLSIDLKQMLANHVLLLLFQLCLWCFLCPNVDVKGKMMIQLKVNSFISDHFRHLLDTS
jgi:hypothetical protein